jgi:DNA recombination protein RmuC
MSDLTVVAAVAAVLAAALVWALLSRARIAATLDAERKAGAEKLAAVSQAEARLRDSFSALSAQALQANNQVFLDLADARLAELHRAAQADLAARQAAIGALVEPVEEGLKAVDAKLQAFDRDRAAAHSAIQEHLRTVMEGQIKLSVETQNLVTALRRPQVRGQWGEMQLRRVVELAGMVEHCDFDAQRTVTTTDGRIRPDLIVKLP